jgi:hypothetical protein
MPFTQGQSGNPRGRPRKNRTLTDILSKYRNHKVENGEFTGLKAQDALVKMIWQHAIYDKDMIAAKYIFDRLDGKPVETLRAEIDRGDIPLFKTLQKELFDLNELEGEEHAGTLEPPEETGAGAGE